MKLTWSLLIIAMLTSFVARADDKFAIRTLNDDELVATAVASISKYFEYLRLENDHRIENGNMIVDTEEITQCDTYRFVAVPSHQQVGTAFRDMLTFYECRQKIGQIVIDRKGPNVKPISNDDLFAFKIPAPSESDEFGLRWDSMNLKIASTKTPNGRRGIYQYSFAGIPLKFDFEDFSETSNGETIDVRKYYLDAIVSNTRQWAKFTEKRSALNDGLPSYAYDVTSFTGHSQSLRPITFLKAYQDAMEENFVDLFAQACKYPSKFPYVEIQ